MKRWVCRGLSRHSQGCAPQERLHDENRVLFPGVVFPITAEHIDVVPTCTFSGRASRSQAARLHRPILEIQLIYMHLVDAGHMSHSRGTVDLHMIHGRLLLRGDPFLLF